jgi:hypothetical protein
MLTGMGMDQELAGLDWREQEAVQRAVREGQALHDYRLARAAVRHGEGALSRLKILSGVIATAAVAFGIGIWVSTGDWNGLFAVAFIPLMACGPLALVSNVRRAVRRNRLVVQGGKAGEIDSVPQGWRGRIADGVMAVYIAAMLIGLTLLTLGLLARFFGLPNVEAPRSTWLVGILIAAIGLAAPLYRIISRRPLQD